MRFYVAASSANLKAAREAMALVQERGHEVPCDWTRHFDDRPRRYPGDYASKDLQGIQAADALLFLFDPKAPISPGAWCELGFALALDKPVFAVVGRCIALEELDRFIFLFAPNVYRSSMIGAALDLAEAVR